jgi:hypothetical protein
MAISTYQVYLMKRADTTPWAYSKLIDIKDYPDLGGPPDMLETTTLSDKAQTYVPGIQSVSALEFTCNYESDDYDDLKNLEGTEHHFAVWMGGTSLGVPDGGEGKFYFSGKLTVYAPGAGVNDVADMLIVIAPSTAISGTAPATP